MRGNAEDETHRTSLPLRGGGAALASRDGEVNRQLQALPALPVITSQSKKSLYERFFDSSPQVNADLIIATNVVK